MGSITATLALLRDFGSPVARTSRRFVACNFLDKVVVVHPDVAPVTWDAIGSAIFPLPGLPVGSNYRGVNAFQGLLVVWEGETLKWSDANDLTMWIPVGTTAGSFVFLLTQPFTLPAIGVESAIIYVDQDPTGLIVGQFVRIDSDPTYTFFQVASVLPATGTIGTISGFIQTIAALATQPLFLQSFVPYTDGGQVYVDTQPMLPLLVVGDAVETPAVALILAAGFAQPAVGGIVTVTVTSTPSAQPGSYVSVGASNTPGQDIYMVSSVNAVTNQMVLVRQGVGASGAAYHYAGELIVDQQSVTVKNQSASTAVVSYFNASLKEVFGFTLQSLNLTGPVAPGTVYPIGTQVFTVDANSAGEVVNTGSLINGRILHFDTLGDYGYLFKHRSIQSVQYVGPSQGTFFIRAEVTDEGLVGDYSFVKVGNDQMFIWGNRGIYKFTGWNQLTPIAQAHYKQLAAELDPSRANQIIGYHNEKDYEIWFIYPRIDQDGVNSLRVFIYNYVEGSSTIDDYPTSFKSVCAMGRIDINQDLTWQNTVGTWAAPVSFSSTAQWNDESADTNPSRGIIGISANAPPFAATMSPLRAMQLYYSAHPVGSPITDPLLFLVWLNGYWQAHGGWPALSVVALTSSADVTILQAFGYVPGSGIPAYFLGSSPSSQPGLLVYDNDVTSRNGDPILCQYESVDYDGGDPLAFKYADTQWFSLQVKSKKQIAMPILVYLGSKANYDDDVVWQAPIILMVAGNKNYVTKTNVKASGRYFRIRLQSATPGLIFRVSQIRILGRIGATY